jgi:NAD(P)-dependent dehydrogenase (short-subunit alcohol dehydrogenase family)
VLCARTRKELDVTVSAIRSAGGEAVAQVADISSASDARAVVQRAIERYGALDVVINNAGILGPRVPIIEFPRREWQRVLQINLTGTFYLSQEAARVMVPRRHGCLIMISSSVGRRGRAQWGAYAVSKSGVEGLVQVMAEELRPHGICVMSFNPGGTRTTMRREAYPEEDPRDQRDPAIPAEALVRLATSASLEISGHAFELETVPAFSPASQAVSLTTRKSK